MNTEFSPFLLPASPSTPPSSLLAQELMEKLVSVEADARLELLAMYRDLVQDETFRAWKQLVDDTRLRDLTLARIHAERMLEAADYTGQPRHRAWALRARGNANLTATEYALALQDFEEAIRLHAKLGENFEVLRTQAGMLYAMHPVGQVQEAMELLEQITRVGEEMGAWRILAVAYTNTAARLVEAGNYSQAQEYYDRSLSYLAQVPGVAFREFLTLHLNQLAGLYTFDPEVTVQRAQDLLAQLRTPDRGADEPVFEGKLEQIIGSAMLLLGRYDEALLHMESARSLLSRNPAELRDHYIWSLPVYMAMNRSQDVLARCRLLEDLPLGNDIWYKLRVGCYEALAQAQVGDIRASIARLQALRPRTHHMRSTTWDAMVDLWLGMLYFQAGRPVRALALARRAAGSLRAERLESEALRADLVMAQSWYRLGRLECAEERARAIVAQASGLGQADVAAHAHHLLGQLALQAGDDAQAEDSFAAAVTAAEGARQHILPDFATHYLVDKEVFYEDWVAQLLRRQDLPGAWRAMERSKARTLSEWLAENSTWEVYRNRTLSDADRNELERLRQDYVALNRRLVFTVIQDPAEIQRLNQQRDRLEAALLDCLNRLQVSGSAYAGDSTLPRTLDSIELPSLAPNSAVVEYYTLGDEVMALVLTDRGILAYRHLASRADIIDSVLSLRLSVRFLARSAQMNRALPSNRSDNMHGLLHRLWSHLWAPLATTLHNVDSVIVVPHGPLHYVPFAALYDGAHYMLERHTLSFLPALSLASLIRLRPAGPVTSLVVAHSQDGALPCTLIEAQAVSEYFPAVLLLEEAATAARIQAEGYHHAILHVAAHGTFRASQPMFSAIHLADGPWSVLDILATLRLNGALVVLSACESGSGQRLGGDEFLGLGRAFFRAGASSLALSLWPVADEATSRLMRAFYRHLQAGQTKANALRSAQLELCHGADIDLRHPYFWAAFVLMGHRGPL